MGLIDQLISVELNTQYFQWMLDLCICTWPWPTFWNRPRQQIESFIDTIDRQQGIMLEIEAFFLSPFWYVHAGPQECIDELCIAWVNNNQCELSADLMAQFCPLVCCEPRGVPSISTPRTTSTSTTRSPTPSTTTSFRITTAVGQGQGSIFQEILKKKWQLARCMGLDPFTVGVWVSVCDWFFSCLAPLNVDNPIEMHGTHSAADVNKDAIANADAHCEWTFRFGTFCEDSMHCAVKIRMNEFAS